MSDFNPDTNLEKILPNLQLFYGDPIDWRRRCGVETHPHEMTATSAHAAEDFLWAWGVLELNFSKLWVTDKHESFGFCQSSCPCFSTYFVPVFKHNNNLPFVASTDAGSIFINFLIEMWTDVKLKLNRDISTIGLSDLWWRLVTRTTHSLPAIQPLNACTRIFNFVNNVQCILITLTCFDMSVTTNEYNGE